MNKRPVYWYVLRVWLLWLVVFAWLPPAAVAQDPPPAVDPRFGVVDSFVNTAEATAAGVGWTRIFLRWDVIQPAGPSDWKPANVPDTYLDAELAAGREIAAVLIGTPAWASDSGASTAVPPMEAWGDFVYKVATQYQGRIKHWIIWNQPDISDPASPSFTWAGSEQDYYRLLKEAYQKIKAVDPQMQVHLAGLTYTWDYERGNAQYLARLLNIIKADPQAAAENDYFDVVSYHLYYNPRGILDTLTEIRSILDAHGLSAKPIWINETNAPPSEDDLEPLPAPAAIKVTLPEQSNYVIQAFALALAGGAERVAFNKMRNESQANTVEPYGLLRADNSRRPAFDAFRVVTTYFAGVQQTSWLQLGEVYIVTLDRGGKTTTVLWNRASSDTIFTLNAIAPQALLVDEQGHEQVISASNGLYVIQLPGAPCSNGPPPTCYIGGAPRLIVEAGSPEQRLALLPLASATPTVPPPPTDTPVPTSPPPPPTLTPTAAPVAAASKPPTATPAAEIMPAMALPDPGMGAPDAIDDSLSLTPVPPVSLTTVLRPSRILWLFIIGVIVFTASYGIQVAIWYKLRR